MKTEIIVLKITYDDAHWDHPSEWNWSDLCDVSFDESIEVATADEVARLVLSK